MNLFIIKLLIANVFFILAGYQDYKSRLISDYIWIGFIISCLPFHVLELYNLFIKIGGLYIINYAIITLISIVLFYVMFRLNLFAEADLIGFILIFIFFSNIPIGYNPVIFSIPGLFPFSILLLGLILGSLTYLSINYMHNRTIIKKYNLDLKLSKKGKLRLFIMVLIPENLVDNLKYIPGGKITLSDTNYSKIEYINVGKTKLVWASAGIPVISFLSLSIFIHTLFFLILNI